MDGSKGGLHSVYPLCVRQVGTIPIPLTVDCESFVRLGFSDASRAMIFQQTGESEKVRPTAAGWRGRVENLGAGNRPGRAVQKV